MQYNKKISLRNIFPNYKTAVIFLKKKRTNYKIFQKSIIYPLFN